MPTRHPRLRAAVLTVAAAAALSACSATDDDTDTPRRPSSTPAARSVAPDSPAAVAATAVGTRSREPVVALHALATSGVTGRGIPRSELPRQAAAIRTQLQAQITEATRQAPPPNSAAAQLVAALRSYEQLAADPTLQPQWLGRLAAADAGWQRAMRALSALAGRDLLADLPRLGVPSP